MTIESNTTAMFGILLVLGLSMFVLYPNDTSIDTARNAQLIPMISVNALGIPIQQPMVASEMYDEPIGPIQEGRAGKT